VTLAIHFMVVAWREVAIHEKLDPASPLEHAADKAGTRFTDCPDCPKMVIVQSGLFVMGADDQLAGPSEGPLRRIMFADRFAIGHEAVTFAAFQAFTRATGHASAACGPAGDSGPVQCVSWQDAQAYVNWLTTRTGKSFRLPSASEWEYVARAGSPPPTSQSRAGVVRASLSVAQPARSNDFGVGGMGAAMAELVQDCWSPTLAELSSSGRALNGGALGCPRVAKYGRIDPASALPRYSGRRPIGEADVYAGVGFRVARDLALIRK
jgi:formylglycine-generating enzyme required for sulfatase activity